MAFRKKLSRAQLLAFLAKQPHCLVAMEACATAHGWGRAISELGHDVRLIPPAYVKPFVKRQKNDAADAEAIAEASITQTTMRFVPDKEPGTASESYDLPNARSPRADRTQLINALRGHLAEHGVIAPLGPERVRSCRSDRCPARKLPMLVLKLAGFILNRSNLCAKIADLEKALRQEARRGEKTSRLQTMPGIGPITAIAIETFAPAMQTFKRGRDFAAWLGLVPIQHSTGGKQRLETRRRWANTIFGGSSLSARWPHSLGLAERRAGRLLASADDGAKTTDARRHGPRQ